MALSAPSSDIAPRARRTWLAAAALVVVATVAAGMQLRGVATPGTMVTLAVDALLDDLADLNDTFADDLAAGDSRIVDPNLPDASAAPGAAVGLQEQQRSASGEVFGAGFDGTSLGDGEGAGATTSAPSWRVLVGAVAGITTAVVLVRIAIRQRTRTTTDETDPGAGADRAFISRFEQLAANHGVVRLPDETMLDFSSRLETKTADPDLGEIGRLISTRRTAVRSEERDVLIERRLAEYDEPAVD